MDQQDLPGMPQRLGPTLRNHEENGKAWSLLNAHAWRDAAARALIEVQRLRTSGMSIIHTVPALLPVTARNT